MASTASPYGLKAVNHIGGTPYAGSTRLLPIASGYGVNIFNGSIVSIVAAGTIEIVVTTGNGGAGDAAAFPERRTACASRCRRRRGPGGARSRAASASAC